MATSKVISNQTIHPIQKWLPGLNTQTPVQLLPEGDAAVALNVDLTTGGVQARPGYSVDATLASGTPIDNMLVYSDTGGTEHTFATAANSLYIDAALVTSSLATTPIAAPLCVRAQYANGALYMAVQDSQYPSVDRRIRKFSSGTVTTISTSPYASDIVFFNNSLWANDKGGYKNRIWWSGQVGTTGLDFWPPNNFVDINASDGDEIIGFGMLHNALIVFKNRSIWRIVGTAPDDAALSTGSMSVSPLGVSSGAVSCYTIASLNGSIVWLNQKGLFIYNGVSILELTETIRPFFATMDPTKVVVSSRGSWISWNQYMLSVPIVGGARQQIVVTTSPKSIVQYSFAKTVTSFTGNLGAVDYVGSNGGIVNAYKPVSFYLGFIDGTIGHFDNTHATDAGVAIPWTYTTGILGLGQPGLVKMCDIVYTIGPAVAGADPITVTLTGDTVSHSTTFTPASTTPVSTTRLSVPAVGRAIQLSLTGNASTLPRSEIDEVSVRFRTLLRT